jgi:hypothetical protein
MSDAFRTNRRRVIVAVRVYLRARAGVKPFFYAGRDTWQFMFIQRAENDYAPYSGLGIPAADQSSFLRLRSRDCKRSCGH